MSGVGDQGMRPDYVETPPIQREDETTSHPAEEESANDGREIGEDDESEAEDAGRA